MSFSGGAGGAIADALGQLLDEALTFVAFFSTAAMVETLLYGMHVILFCVFLYLFVQKKRPTQWVIFASALLMFLLSTADIGISFRVMSYIVPRLAEPNMVGVTMRLVHAKNAIFVGNNLIADIILFYRCWMVWGGSKYVLAGCLLLVLGDTSTLIYMCICTLCSLPSVWGFLGLGPAIPFFSFTPNKFVPIYIWSILAINVLLTLVTIGRIFWISRVAKRLMGQKQITVYHTAIAILAESGLVYTICLLVYIVFPATNPYKVVVVLFIMRIVAIMPTLLIVQVGLGAAVRELNVTPVATLSQFEVRDNCASVVLDTLGGSMLPTARRPITFSRPSPHGEEAARSTETIELAVVRKSKAVSLDDRRPRSLDHIGQTTKQ